jgi:hypothetical protein
MHGTFQGPPSKGDDAAVIIFLIMRTLLYMLDCCAGPHNATILPRACWINPYFSSLQHETLPAVANHHYTRSHRFGYRPAPSENNLIDRMVELG